MTSGVEELAALFASSATLADDSNVPPLEDVPELKSGYKTSDSGQFPRPRLPNKSNSNFSRERLRCQSNELTDESILRTRGKMLTKIGELMFNSKGDCDGDSDDEKGVNEATSCGGEEDGEKGAFCGFKPGFLAGSGNQEMSDDQIIEVKVKRKVSQSYCNSELH
jgi:hypothetical protein